MHYKYAQTNDDYWRSFVKNTYRLYKVKGNFEKKRIKVRILSARDCDHDNIINKNMYNTTWFFHYTTIIYN